MDLKNDMVDIKGNLIPENIINSAIKKIPIISNVLGGKDKKGAIATTYSIKGTIDNMSANVNPLSILAPNFLLDIIDDFKDSNKNNENINN